MSTETTVVDEASVFADISGMLRDLLEEYGLDDTEITMDTKFHDDLELESIDLVALSGSLRDRYGETINFAQFIADKELGEIMAMTVGELVLFVVKSLS
ncbi:acyl carrier protein [Amycolatopsis xylanica]|uniref:Acyl carrier protein n=1 Tax=Amycolatopsis xylanica TaxID=589385 RepID=A0A1H2SV50_9PSEU|nr:phosphopantetheine-binding protein [Amycolatopsis xylanica]SDW35450.1 acyl carrier protein [Amycolatopsis xylanica]